MIKKTELTLYARTERLKDKISSYLQGFYIFYLHFAIIVAMPITLLTGCMIWYQIIYSSVPPEAKVFSLQLSKFLNMAFIAIVGPTAVIYTVAVVLTFLAVGIGKLLQAFTPLQNRLADYNTSLSQEYKKIYKPISYDSLMWLLKETNYNLAPNSTVSLLNSDDPRNVTYTIQLLANQAGATTISKFLQAIALDRATVLALSRDDWQANRLTSLSMHKVTSYLQQSNMDLFLAELQSTNGWGRAYRGEKFLNKTRAWIGAPIIERLTSQDYTRLSQFILQHKNQIERATEKLLSSLERHTPRYILDEQQPEPVEAVSFTPHFKSRFSTFPQQRTALAFDDVALYDEEEAPLINSARPHVS